MSQHKDRDDAREKLSVDEEQLFLQLAQHKVESIRVDREENLRSLIYYGAVVVAFLSFVKLENLKGFIDAPILGFLTYRIAVVVTLLLGTLGAGLVWMHVKELHMSELELTGSIPGRLFGATHGNLRHTISDMFDQQYRRFRRYRAAFWAGYWLLTASIGFFVCLVAAFLMKSNFAAN